MRLNQLGKKAEPICAVILVLLLAAVGLPAFADRYIHHRAGHIRVMTQNLYVGTDILDIALAPDLCELMAATHVAMEQILANDFQQRAEALARLIARKRPAVVGLQEGYRVIQSYMDGTQYSEDYPALLLSALSERGVDYYPAGSRASTPITVPADSDRDCDIEAPSLTAADYLVTIVDQDVILCRPDIDCDNAVESNFATNAEASTPAGPVTVERGWVSVVASVNGRDYRVVDTHLEIDVNPTFRAVQYAQARELAFNLDFLAGEGLPQIVLGDFNSDDSPFPPSCDYFDPCFSGYQVMAESGFDDLWLKRRGKSKDGFTCCQDVDLLNSDSHLSMRIDQVWARGSGSHYGGSEVHKVSAGVVGDKQRDRSSPDNLWPSDHAGVIADLILRSPGPEFGH